MCYYCDCDEYEDDYYDDEDDYYEDEDFFEEGEDEDYEALYPVDVKETVENFVTKNKTFSAWNITQELRNMDYWAEHDFVKKIVHDHMIDILNYGSRRHQDGYIEYYSLVNEQQVKAPTTRAPLQKLTMPIRYSSSYPHGRVTIPATSAKLADFKVGDVVGVQNGEIWLASAVPNAPNKYIVDEYNAIRINGKLVKGPNANIEVYDNYIKVQ